MLATWLRYSYLFLSPNLLPLSYPQTLVSLLALPISVNGRTQARNLRYHFWFFSLISDPTHPHIMLYLQNLSWANPLLLAFTAFTSLFQGIIISCMNYCSSLLTGLLVSFPVPHKFFIHTAALGTILRASVMSFFLKIFQWLPIPFEWPVSFSATWMALNDLSPSHCSSLHSLDASHLRLSVFFKRFTSFLGSFALLVLPAWDAFHKAGLAKLFGTWPRSHFLTQTILFNVAVR